MEPERDFGKALADVIKADVLQELKGKASERRRRGQRIPEGTVTILFTDIEDSTAIVQRLGDRDARAIIRRHDEALRRVIDTHQGTEVERVGDSFMVAFSTAR